MTFCILGLHQYEVFWKDENKTDLEYACIGCGKARKLVTKNIEPLPYSKLLQLRKTSQGKCLS